MPISKRVFSGSSGGRAIAIGTGLTTIHTTVSSTSDYDEIFFYVHNSASVSRKLTAYFGATAVRDKVVYSVPAQDALYLIGPGMPLGLGRILKALATAGSTTLTAHGWVNRIEQ
jgi:hypothetical protein